MKDGAVIAADQPPNIPPPKPLKFHFSFSAHDREIEGAKPCTGSGDCGPCAGICLIVRFGVVGGGNPPANPGQSLGLAEVVLLEGPTGVVDKMNIVYHKNADQGDEQVEIEYDFFIGDEASRALGYKSVTIRQGMYPIDYSNHPAFGESTFDVCCVR